MKRTMQTDETELDTTVNEELDKTLTESTSLSWQNSMPKRLTDFTNFFLFAVLKCEQSI